MTVFRFMGEFLEWYNVKATPRASERTDQLLDFIKASRGRIAQTPTWQQKA